MKIKILKKDILKNYDNIICVGYCGLWYLLAHKNANFYTCGVYGWNADIYEINNNTCLVTGYRPFGNITSNKNIDKKYNEKAKKIYYNKKWKYETITKKLEKLIESYINECLGV